MADTESQKELWSQTTATMRNDLEIPMDVIATQTKTLTKNWVNGFSEMMFDDVKYNKEGLVDLSKTLKPRMMSVSFNAVENGILTEKKLEMPLLGAVDYPALELDNINLKLNYNVGTNDELTNKSDSKSEFEVGANGKVMGVGINASVKFSMSQSEERTRKTDTRASLTVDANYSRVAQGEAISRIAEILMNNAVNTSQSEYEVEGE
ncbi:DUF2589 domain-containing protein [Citrobacter amalonaticus]|nr:DUF2589 domain-containing protein [Citrobacter amalonaticus]